MATKSVAGVVLLGISVLFALWYGEYSPEGQRAQADLTREARETTETAGLESVRSDAHRGLGKALVQTEFKVADIEDALRKIDATLTTRGWKKVGARKVYDWGRDLGERAIDYCTGSYGAEVFV